MCVRTGVWGGSPSVHVHVQCPTKLRLLARKILGFEGRNRRFLCFFSDPNRAVVGLRRMQPPPAPLKAWTLLCCCTSASARLRAAAVYFARLPLTPGSNHARTTVSPHHTSNTSEQLHVGVWRCVPLCRRAATNAEAISRLAEAKIFLLFPGSDPGNFSWRGSCAQPWRQCSCVQPAVLLQ